MPHQDPDHEHVFLTAYERRQLELIEQVLADEDPRRPQAIPLAADNSKLSPLWLALVIVCALIALLGVIAGAALLVLLAIAAAAGAFALYRRDRRRSPAGN